MNSVNLTCVECPLGCSITVCLKDGKVETVSGNSCPRGKTYAESEVVCPKRVLTTTVKTADGRILAVKTDNTVPKADLMKLMQRINGIIANTPVKIGDIIVKNLIEGVNLVATDYLE